MSAVWRLNGSWGEITLIRTVFSVNSLWIFWIKHAGKYNKNSLWSCEQTALLCEQWCSILIKTSLRRIGVEESKCLKICHFDDCDICIIKKERVSSAPYMIWLLHWWNYLSWNKLICLSGTEDNLITHLSKVPDYVWGNWQLIITHNSCQRFDSLQKKIDETQSKLGTVIHSRLWWEKAYVTWINEKDSWVRFT